MKHTDTFINSCVDACKVASVVSNSLRPYGLYVASQAPFSVGFPRQEYWSGLPFALSWDHPDPGTEPEPSSLMSHALAGRFFPTE